MPDRVPRIYTRSGDKGETSLIGGKRESKYSPRVQAYGAVDELNAFVGLCVVWSDQADIKNHLMNIQQDLHGIGSNLAYPENLSQAPISGESIAARIPRITPEHVKKLEQWIDGYNEELTPLKSFILCGGTKTSSLLHVARNVCRRAERHIVQLKDTEEVDIHILEYINRLSDYLFTAARLTSRREGAEDIKWDPAKTTLSQFMEDEE